MSAFKAKMHQSRFPWGSAPDSVGEAYSAPSDPQAVFKAACLGKKWSIGREREE